jgi:hypothetical protein
MAVILNFLFGCRHKQITRPMTPGRKPGTRFAGTYVACLECGAEFRYDLDEMRIGESIPRQPLSSNVIAARAVL